MRIWRQEPRRRIEERVGLVFDIQFAGRTVEDLSREIEKRYAQDLKSPRVSIQVRGYAAQKAYISGEVPKPGMISLATPMTVLAAIGEAGGITIRGNRNRVVLIRKMPDGKPARREIVLFASSRLDMGFALAILLVLAFWGGILFAAIAWLEARVVFWRRS